MRKTAGQLAYEEDVTREPTYHDGTTRKPWAQLPAYARESWERNPTPRAAPYMSGDYVQKRFNPD